MKHEMRELYNDAAKIYIRHCLDTNPEKIAELPSLVTMVDCIVSEYKCYCDRERNRATLQVNSPPFC